MIKQNIIAYEIAELRRAILNISLDLKTFEEKYQFASDIFYQQFSQGLLEDSEDFMIWSGLYEMLIKNQAKRN